MDFNGFIETLSVNRTGYTQYKLGSVKEIGELCAQKQYKLLLKKEDLFFKLFCKCLLDGQTKDKDVFIANERNFL